jgi:hypothetical protein
MAIVVRRTEGDFQPCPAGTWPAVCVDVVDLGAMKSAWKEEPVHKIRLVWQISERMPDGRPYLVQRMYTASLHEKSSLRKDLSSWRGQDFKTEELNGFDLENVLGVGCLLSVVQQAGNDGQIYANIIAVMRLPNGYEAPQPDGYVRVIHRPQDGLVSAPRSSQGLQQQASGRRQPGLLPKPPLPPSPVAPRAPQQQAPWEDAPHPEEVTDEDVPL